MGSTREKGKIPHSEWPKILARYNGGETIASIGRAYKCTGPAIRYIVKRTASVRTGKPGSSLSRKAVVPSSDRSTVMSLPLDRAASVRDEILGDDLRQRVSGDIASFLVALDQVVLEGSSRSAVVLQEATDRLMRSTARIRLELERMLSASKGAGPGKAAREKILSLPNA